VVKSNCQPATSLKFSEFPIVAQNAVRTPLSVVTLRQILEAAGQAGSLANVVIEVDVGLHRCGVQPSSAALALAQRAAELPGIHLAGVLGYEGHAVFVADAEQRSRLAREAVQALVDTAELIRQAKVPVEIVSAEGTGTYNLTGTFPGVTEVEAGSYPFMDTKYRRLGLPFRCTLTLLATVISTPTPAPSLTPDSKS
jgi:D-serine deaminase-like pyridoxal phosphate-dependent protein